MTGNTKMIRDALGSPVPQTLNDNGTYTVLANGDTTGINFSKYKLLRDALGSPIPYQYFDVEQMKFVDGVLGGSGTGAVDETDLTNIEQSVQEIDDRLTTHLDDYATTIDVTYYVDINSGDDSNDGLTQNSALKTINAAVNKLPQLINHDCVIYLLDGNHINTTAIFGRGGSGTVTITSLSQSPYNVSVSGFDLRNTSCQVILKDINVWHNPLNRIAIHAYNAIGLDIENVISEIESNWGVLAYHSSVSIKNSVISNKSGGAVAADLNTRIFSSNNTGVSNTKGLYATNGGVIAKHNTQPLGVVAELVENGGEIR